MYKLGLDIGGTKINVGILDCSYNLLGTKKLYVNKILYPESEIKAAVLELCKELDISYGDISSCGVGVPGTVSEDGKTLIKAPNISILSPDFAIRTDIENL